jgi:hypothetical protein
MGLERIILRPGINTVATQTLNEGGYSKSNLIRWRTGLVEKIGGWIKLCQTAVNGVARGLHAFTDLSGFNYLAIGTNSNLEILSSGTLYDITPLVHTSNITPEFTTSSGSNSVKIHDTTYSPDVGDYINIYIPVSVGGIVLYGLYPVITSVDSTHYTINASSNATANVTNGGAVPLFSTTNTSATVQVTLNNHGLMVNSTFPVEVSTTVATVVINGTYLVTSIVDANNFDIVANSSANATTTGSENSGNARILYLLPAGPVSDTVLTGWGAGGYGLGAYGIGATSGTAVDPLRNWFLDNFGENLLAVPTNGSLYQWVPPPDLNNVATLVANAPTINAGMFVAMPTAQVVMLGSETGSVQDPLLVRWSDNGDYSSSGSWTASATNQAGSYRLSRGSEIIGGLQAQQYALIGTDTDMWSMTYIQPPFIYDFTVIGQNCGMMAAKTIVLLNGNAYWTSHSGFYQYGTTPVTPLTCPIFDTIFQNIDYANHAKAFMAGNSLFNEWMFFYPSLSGATGEIDSYAKFNVLENLWDYGSLIRTCWIDQNNYVQGYPIAIDGIGLIQQHEIGYDADGAAMEGVYVESGYVDVSGGTIFLFLDWIIPDILMTGTNPSVTITVYTVYYPGDTPTAFGPFTITPTTEYITLRTRARQMAFKIQSDSLGTFWRIGAMRYRGKPSGRV